ncbi:MULTISPECIES: FAD-dependent monooxygenase [unclassified Gordonia (in: high G+C Gram-positive bacteria)]|uniref:FAD-dependent monooxygenase n=1 Tax=unclassified Gordonia (in: high G+C Gram-positive bacteria) TaxID=2657482 RepID=UPI0009914075|nr:MULTISPECIES: FAD-dependent monooxygenase [unclassified Gordonia (in: high G+C Gram-positive bacteria)]MCX2754233.1 FAD-dependent monooxygenase [Gordonia sp. 4N]
MSKSDLDNGRAFVVGGGIGGLATALGLTKSGCEVSVVEQAAAFGEIGAGLQIGPNATRILDSWGLLDKVEAIGVLPNNIVMRDAISGEEVARLPLGEEFRERYGAPYVVIHRTDLHAILLEACRDAGVEMRTDVRIERVDIGDAGTTAVAADGRTFDADVTIGADGLRSVLRQTVVGDEPVPSGYVAYRGTVPIENVPEHDRELNDVVVWVGPGWHLVQYRLRAGQELNQVAVFESPGFLRGDSEFGGVDEFRAVFAGCHPRVRSALMSVNTDRHWPLYDRRPADFWGKDRMVLTGDAAHPMLQYLAQGCCQALEDAKTLEILVADVDHSIEWPTVLAQFSESRIPRTAEVQTKARMFGDICHASGVNRVLRNELLARINGTDLYDHADWLYRGPVLDLLQSRSLTGV